MHVSNAILIREPFASAAQTAKILGVSKARKQQLLKMLRVNKSKKFVAHKKIKTPKETNWSMSARFVGKPAKVRGQRRVSKRSHASKKTRSSSG